ncbi:hypothetical protein WBP06_18455 (plasmid) [Novosphingobium sp. BL-8H]|uniref:hypothetical protein n=1 Tax=Novosphingobium sp. BL-8H TaxID=3127640 RepID=UPI00375839EB
MSCAFPFNNHDFYRLQENEVSAAELLLPRLNQALVNILTASDAVIEGPINDEGETVEQVLRPIMRRLLLCQTLGQYSLLAIAGTQGAGKTTLIKSLYELEGADADWLKPNEGRGETYPILVTEGAPDAAAEGFVWRLEQDGDRRHVARVSLLDGRRSVVEAQELFRRACSETDANELLVELRLPGKLRLGDYKGWLLLPGYEASTRDNEVWQKTMRAALAGASGAIVVTDETRLARDQSDLARDAIGTALGNIAPVVVISKTESIRNDAERLADLEVRAAEAFGVPGRRVQCVGLADDAVYNRAWREALKEKIEQFVVESGGGTRNIWHSTLATLVRQDLKRALAGVNRQLRIVLADPEGVNAQVDFARDMLEKFDEANDRLRPQYSSAIQKSVDAHTGAAKAKIEAQLIENFEGVKSHARSFFDTETERLIKLKSAVAKADEQAGRLAPMVVQALTGLIEKVLAPSRSDGVKTSSRLLLGKLSTGNSEVELIPWAGGGSLEKESSPVHALVTLFSAEKSDDVGKPLVGLDEAVKILPALTLEWARAANTAIGTPMPAATEDPWIFDPLGFALKNGEETISNARSLMRTIAATILAADIAELSDQAGEATTGEAATGEAATGETISNTSTSESDQMSGVANAATIGLAGKAAAALLTNPVFLAGTAIVAAGYLTVSMLQEVRAHDRANRASALGMLQRAGEFRLQQYMASYDEMMASMRENLEHALRRRYRIADSLARKDRIVHAIAVAQQLREEFSESLEDPEHGTSSLRLQFADVG